jgi:hypothetical protein
MLSAFCVNYVFRHKEGPDLHAMGAMVNKKNLIFFAKYFYLSGEVKQK